jgi:hypothetical protein
VASEAASALNKIILRGTERVNHIPRLRAVFSVGLTLKPTPALARTMSHSLTSWRIDSPRVICCERGQAETSGCGQMGARLKSTP